MHCIETHGLNMTIKTKKDKIIINYVSPHCRHSLSNVDAHNALINV